MYSSEEKYLDKVHKYFMECCEHCAHEPKACLADFEKLCKLAEGFYYLREAIRHEPKTMEHHEKHEDKKFR